MKNLFIIIVSTIIIGSSLHSESYHFVANDPYYKVPIKIDSINVYYMNTGKDTTIVSSSVHLGTITTVELNEEYNDVRLYPNPANDLLNIEFTSNNIASSLISVVDIEGRKLYSENKYLGIGKQNLNLNIAGLNQEFYFITIGKSTHKFIKIGSSNGSDISLTQITSPSLIKENSIQSQYDYKFTIYAEGFKSKVYYASRTSDRETIIVEMTSLPTGFKGKHIKITLKVFDLVLNYLNRQHNWHDITRVEKINYTDTFIDTLVIRNGRINLIKYYARDDYDGEYDRHTLNFDIDTVNRTISNLTFIYEYDKSYQQGDQYHNDEFHSSFKFDNALKYQLDNGFQFQMKFIESNYRYNYSNYEYFSVMCPGHYETWAMEAYNPEISYIKIEFID